MSAMTTCSSTEYSVRKSMPQQRFRHMLLTALRIIRWFSLITSATGFGLLNRSPMVQFALNK